MARDLAPWAFCALVVIAPQALGGIYPSAMVAIAMASGTCLALALVSARSTDLPSNLFLAVTLGPLLWTAFQVIPLPCGWVEVLSPMSVSRLRETYSLFRLDAPTLCTLTRDPAATREEVVKGLAVACGLLTGAMLAARGRQRVVFGAIAASTVLMALVALGHKAVGATLVFGVYEPIELRNAPLLAPLLNPNNLGGFLAMGVPLLIGLAFEAENPRLRIALLAALGIITATALMTRSRGAAGALALGPALYAGIALLRTRPDAASASSGPAWLRHATPVGIAVVLVLAGWAWSDELAAEFETSGWDKLDLIGRAAQFAATVPWVGVGRGAFSSVFVNTLQKQYRFDYAESLPVQWAVDWGTPATLALIIGLGWLWLRGALRARSHARVGAVAAVATVVAQNLVDLGLELLGPALVTASLLGGCASFPRSTRGSVKRARGLWLVGGAVAAGALIVPPVLASNLMAEHGPSVEARLLVSLEAQDHEAFHALLQRAMIAHPSEPILAIYGAQEALRRNDPEAGQLINRGMVLAPGWSAPHVQAIQWLWNRGARRQALLELRAASELQVHSAWTLLCPMAKSDLQGVLEVGAPRGPSRGHFLELLSQCGELSPASLVRIDEEILRIAPRAVAPRVRAARRSFKEGRFEESAKRAEEALRLSPADGGAAMLAAESYGRLGRFSEAFALLARASDAGAPPTDVYTSMARIAAQAGDRTQMREALSRLRGWLGTNKADLDRAYRLEAELERQAGNLGAALRAYDEAYRITQSPDALRAVAETAVAMGDIHRAIRAYNELCALGSEGGDACQRRDKLRSDGLNR